jgi:hypothetical protein
MMRRLVPDVFLEVNKSKPVVLFELAKGWLTGEGLASAERAALVAGGKKG